MNIIDYQTVIIITIPVLIVACKKTFSFSGKLKKPNEKLDIEVKLTFNKFILLIIFIII